MKLSTDAGISEADSGAIFDHALTAVLTELAPEGASFQVLATDHKTARLDLRLSVDDAECADCVMPASYLKELIAGSLRQRVDRAYTVTLDDPRTVQDKAATTGALAGNLEVLDPTGSVKTGNPDPGPAAGSLAGKLVLFRVDALWRAWDWTVDEWTLKLAEAGAVVTTWRRFQGLPGDEGRAAQAEYAGLVGKADVVISGLGNCGSCSAWTIKDALTALNVGKPTVAVVTQHFEPLARVLAEDNFRPGLRLHVLPYPLDTRPESEVREIARSSLSGLLKRIGAVA